MSPADAALPLDETHDPSLESWVQSAQTTTTDFPIQNLPFGVFRRTGSVHAQVGVAIGDEIVDVGACIERNLIPPEARDAAHACAHGRLNELMALGPEAARALRRALSELLSVDGEAHRREPSIASRVLVPMRNAEMLLPAEIGDYSDFYASIHHATNVGRMLRPDNPLLPNYKYVPIGYHGRASSIVPSGASIRRPRGQVREDQQAPPLLTPSRRLDYELEVGAFVGRGNVLGQSVAIADAERHLFGLCLVNDWSARDMQTWEYQPLGPFLAKSFATTVSPWIVTLDALSPFRAPLAARPAGDPSPLPYLSSEENRARGAFDVTLEVFLRSARMREQQLPPMRVSRGNLSGMYWSIAQLVTHHTVNGCNLRPGDLLASGTVSGPEPDSRGCLLERTWRGTEPLELPSGERRSFLEDGDEVIMCGHCERPGARRIGFGTCSGVVVGTLDGSRRA
jgi:fumarylacetoacetase